MSIKTLNQLAHNSLITPPSPTYTLGYSSLNTGLSFSNPASGDLSIQMRSFL